MLAVFAVPVLAQTKECNDENKAAWYDTFLKNYKGEPPQQKIAYDAAKLYLNSCPADPADKIAEFMKNKFVIPYEAMTAGVTLKKQFDDSFKQKNYADQVRLGKQIVATEPDNSAVYIIMGVAGLGDESLLNESAQSARKAIELVEAGKPFAPYDSRDKALAALNYVLARSYLKNSPTEAIPYLIKAAKYPSDLSKNPQVYLDLAAAYNDGPRVKLTEEYKSKVGPNQTETPESKLALANLDQILDRQIDAWARAAALADAANKSAIMGELEELYKYRNKSTAGLPELVANVMSKPLPDVPTPLTSLPSTPSSTPSTSGSTTNGGAQAGSGGGAKTGAANGASTTGQNKTGSVVGGTGSAKPAASPTPASKKPRAHHSIG
jgi:tetratricopeptide (TPR) repeat protein